MNKFADNDESEDEMERRLEQIRDLKVAAIRKQEFIEAAAYREQETQLTAEIRERFRSRR